MTNLVPKPTVRKDGVATTVHVNPDKGAPASSTARLDAISGKQPAEKRTLIKPPKYWGDSRNVVEVGSEKSEYGEQNLYLNGKVIGRISSNEEMQHRKIKGTRLSQSTGSKKVWRVSGHAPRVPGDVMGQYVSDDGFSRASAAHSFAERMARHQESAKKEQEYVARGGFYFDRKPAGKLGEYEWTVGGDQLPETDLEVVIPHSTGTVSKGLFLRVPGRNIETDLTLNDKNPGGYIKVGRNDFAHYTIDLDTGKFIFEENTPEFSESVAEFVQKAESYVIELLEQHTGERYPS